MLCIRLCLVFILLCPFTLQANGNIVVIGDSLSAGFGLKQNEVWVDLLAQRINEQQRPFNVINASISGETTLGGRERISAIIQHHHPSIAIIELGGNDGLRGLNLDVIKDNLNAIISQLQHHQITVLLVGLRLPPNYGPVYTKRFEQIYTDLATEKNVPVVPSILRGLEDGLDLYQADGIHPTANAQPIMLENIWQQLRLLLDNSVVAKD